MAESNSFWFSLEGEVARGDPDPDPEAPIGGVEGAELLVPSAAFGVVGADQLVDIRILSGSVLNILKLSSKELCLGSSLALSKKLLVSK